MKNTADLKRILVKIYQFALRPVTCQPAFFILLCVLLVVPDTYSRISSLSAFKVALELAVCYLLVLPVPFIPSLSRKIYKSIILSFALFFYTIDIYLLLLYNESFGAASKDTISAILATNPAEAQEYLDVYITADRILLVLVLISIPMLLAYYLRKSGFQFNIRVRRVMALFLFVSMTFTIVKCNEIKEGNLYYLLTNECPDLRKYRQNPNVVCSDERVDNIVLIIGESYSKYNSSLYGYDKETTPFLSRMKDENELFVYENVTSACLNTIPAIKSIMMAYTDNMSDSIEWYRCLTLIEVMQKAGYKTYWLSNQSKTGIIDNEVGCFADLCDEQSFVGDKHSGEIRSNKDEELLPILEKCLSDNSSPKFIIMQMMGSHAKYSKRYPSGYSKFKGADYNVSHSRLSSENRQILAEYDNSILYNDYVIHELMRKFALEDATVVYFSDHGEDVFHSSNTYCGHGAGVSAAHESFVKQIPLMFYTTPLFREKHPGLQQKIESSVNNAYRTDSIMYTIMDIAGVETVIGISYKHKSLFK